eukprot:gnl/Chilomastix_caulleri/3491.p3 GENE.gnl/Chilomastix_caulleri/3491~~gnl/Chilomastix_caulleri/3491.p3  ORF type:complete len:53 (-),score=8.72 gnl/Chilomastix_caulleri/3491:201-359(-)
MVIRTRQVFTAIGGSANDLNKVSNKGNIMRSLLDFSVKRQMMCCFDIIFVIV